MIFCILNLLANSINNYKLIKFKLLSLFILFRKIYFFFTKIKIIISYLFFLYLLLYII